MLSNDHNVSINAQIPYDIVNYKGSIEDVKYSKRENQRADLFSINTRQPNTIESNQRQPINYRFWDWDNYIQKFLSSLKLNENNTIKSLV